MTKWRCDAVRNVRSDKPLELSCRAGDGLLWAQMRILAGPSGYRAHVRYGVHGTRYRQSFVTPPAGTRGAAKKMAMERLARA